MSSTSILSKLNTTFMRSYLFLTLFAALILSSCTSEIGYEPIHVQEDIVGKWMMHKIYLKGEDITEHHNPNNSRWVKFASDGKYFSGGNPYGLSIGKWMIDENKSTLHIKSGDLENSDWEISLKGNKLVWKGIGSESIEDFKFILKRNDWKNS